MGIESRINLIVISYSTSFLGGIKTLLKDNNGIHLKRCCRNLNDLLREFKSRDSSL